MSQLFTVDLWAAWGFGQLPRQPVPQSTLFLGGSHNFSHMEVLPGERSVLRPKLVDRLPNWKLSSDELQAPVLIETEIYHRRLFRPCFDAAPFGIWVESNLEEKDATALWRELAA